ncbi:MAG: hypothetical protein DMG40_17360 [Acidobacteria bacterium]|nr:MAG: hypothetical protein DMG40_17360 [Acidobacteriota bacterium]
MAAFALAFLPLPRIVAQTPPQESCKSDDSAKIVRIDDRNERIFVIVRVDQINTVSKARKVLLPLQASLKQCRPGWGKTWSVSFFSDAKYAGYKYEDNVAALVANGSWSKAYLGEYERQTQRLIMNPAERERIRFLKIPLP